jgi:hypothetical protein
MRISWEIRLDGAASSTDLFLIRASPDPHRHRSYRQFLVMTRRIRRRLRAGDRWVLPSPARR